MKHPRSLVLATTLALILPLAACDVALPQFGRIAAPQTSAAADPVNVRVAGADTPRPDARPEAGASAALAGDLGTTLATLGDASVRGFWMETSQVTVPTRGRVSLPGGTSVELDLIPSGGILGAGSRLSLQAMQALGLPLTAVAEVSVAAL